MQQAPKRTRSHARRSRPLIRSVVAITGCMLAATIGPAAAQIGGSEPDRAELADLPSSAEFNFDGATDRPPPPGTPFDEFEAPKPDPIPAPEEHRIEDAITFRDAMGFEASRQYIESLYDAAIADPSSPEAEAVGVYQVPMTRAELDEMYRRASMGEDQWRLIEQVQHVDGFAGHWIDQPSGGSQVLAFQPGTDLKPLSELFDSYEHPRHLILVEHRYSLSELLSTRDELIARASDQFEPEKIWIGVDQEQNTVLVKADPSVLAFFDVGEFAESPGLLTPEPIEDFQMASEVSCDRVNCWPFTAGMIASGCTWGFVVRTVQAGVARLNFSSAGHCVPDDTTPTLPGPDANVIHWVNNGVNTDLALYSVPTPLDMTNDVYRSSSGVNQFGVAVTQALDPQQNAAVCKSGKTSGYYCGTITQAAPNQYALANYRSCPGDSGGPVFTNFSASAVRAVGWHQGSSANNDDCDLVPPVPAAGTRSVTVQSRMQILRSDDDRVYVDASASGPRRDFVISLYRRALNRSPDQGGYDAAVPGPCNQTTLDQLVFGFYTSPEFKGRSGRTDVMNDSQLRNRFADLYRGAMRREGSFAERNAWVGWVRSEAANYSGTLVQRNEAAYNAAVDYFMNSPEGTALFQPPGTDGEIWLCAA